MQPNSPYSAFGFCTSEHSSPARLGHPFIIDPRALICLLLGGRSSLPLDNTILKQSILTWNRTLRLLSALKLHTHTLIWDNPSLPEFSTLPDSHFWIRSGLVFLHQLFVIGEFSSYMHLPTYFPIESAQLFWYFQLWHATHTQRGSLSFQADGLLIIILLQKGPHRDLKGMPTCFKYT